jgi:AcrR family transcriptional regulator
MVAAAHQTFVQHGYVGARMTDIAQEAGVAVQTLYFTFHTKPELLRACFDQAVLGDDGLPPQLQPWWQEMLAAPDGPTLIGRFVAGNTEIVTRVGRLEDVVRAAGHEPDIIALHAETERLRREGYATVIAALSRFGLQAGLSRERATDVLMAIAGPGLYRALVIDAGWPSKQFVAWQTAGLIRLLLAETAVGAAERVPPTT